MLLELVGREHVLAVGHGVRRIAIVLLEGIHHERAADLDRLFAAELAIEHQPSAEPSRRRLVGLREHGVGPHGDHLHGSGDFTIGSLAPGNLVIQIELVAAGQGDQREG